jgi:hypothetical protein
LNIDPFSLFLPALLAGGCLFYNCFGRVSSYHLHYIIRWMHYTGILKLSSSTIHFDFTSQSFCWHISTVFAYNWKWPTNSTKSTIAEWTMQMLNAHSRSSMIVLPFLCHWDPQLHAIL